MSNELTTEISKLIEKLINKTDQRQCVWVANRDRDIFTYDCDKFRYKIVTSGGGVGLYVRIINENHSDPIISIYGSSIARNEAYNMLSQLHRSIKKYLGIDIISDVESMLWKSSKIDEALNSL